MQAIQSGRVRPAAGTSPDLPLVTVVREGARRVIAAVDQAAADLGLRPGQSVAQAEAAVPGLTVVEATPAADALALSALAEWCLGYAPVVQPDPPDGIFIDVSGAAHLFGGEAGLLDDVIGRLAKSGLSVRGAVADTPGAAAALARFGRETIVLPGQNAAALAPLPIGALRMATKTRDTLRRLGIERIGQLGQLPRSQVTRRFGPEVMDLYDLALGHAAAPLVALVPAEAPQVRLAFAEPLGHIDALGAVVAQLAQDLCRMLAQREQGLRRLDAVFRRVDGQPLGIRVGTARATRDPQHCGRLLGERLPEIDPGFGIDEVSLVASRTESLAAHQTTCLVEGEGSETLGQLVDKLGIRLGTDRVFRAAPIESEYPERAVGRVPALAPASGFSWPERLPRPSRLVSPPEPVSAVALTPDHPPAVFIWRHQRIRVRHADGPERIRGEWWRSDGEFHTLRDYYRVEDDTGRRFWIFRDAPMEEGGQWWLHGFFS